MSAILYLHAYSTAEAQNVVEMHNSILKLSVNATMLFSAIESSLSRLEVQRYMFCDKLENYSNEVPRQLFASAGSVRVVRMLDTNACSILWTI